MMIQNQSLYDPHPSNLFNGDEIWHVMYSCSAWLKNTIVKDNSLDNWLDNQLDIINFGTWSQVF